MDTRDIVARNRGRKANRIIRFLDRHFGVETTAETVTGWDTDQWRRVFTRAGEHFNETDPTATPNTVTALLRIRDRLRRERRHALEHALVDV